MTENVNITLIKEEKMLLKHVGIFFLLLHSWDLTEKCWRKCHKLSDSFNVFGKSLVYYKSFI